MKEKTACPEGREFFSFNSPSTRTIPVPMAAAGRGTCMSCLSPSSMTIPRRVPRMKSAG